MTTKKQSLLGRRGRPIIQRRRKGIIVALTAFILVIVFAFVAFAIDTGRIVVTRANMQKGTDAVALAATQELATHWDRQMPWAEDNFYDFTNPDLDGSVTAAKIVAGQVAAANGVHIDVNSDIQFGRLAANNAGVMTTTWDVGPYNVVRVSARRDQTDVSLPDGRFRLSFGWAVGVSSVELTTFATAAFDDGIRGFSAPGEGESSPLLPFALAATAWQDMLSGGGSDDWTYDENTGNITAGGDGIPEIRMFGGDDENNNNNNNNNNNGGNDAQVAPGNFGILDIGAANNGEPDVARQIEQGPSADDFSYHNDELAVGSDGLPLPLNGTTGLKASMQSSLEDVMGQNRVVPLYNPVTGNGANAQFNIIGFVGVRILSFELTGGDKHILIQPAPIIDTTVITGSTTNTNFGGMRAAIRLIE